MDWINLTHLFFLAIVKIQRTQGDFKSLGFFLFRGVSMYNVTLKVPYVPKSLNKAMRSHYLSRNRQHKRWKAIVSTHMVTNRLKMPEEPLKKARIRIVRHFYRSLDYDGLVGSLKPVVDALVALGVLKDDNWEVLGAWDVSHEFRSKKDGPLLEIEVIECP